MVYIPFHWNSSLSLNFVENWSFVLFEIQCSGVTFSIVDATVSVVFLCKKVSSS
jgi:hypothetical protein